MKEKCAAVDAYSAQRKVWLPINCALAYKAVKPLNEGGGAEAGLPASSHYFSDRRPYSTGILS